MDKLSPHVYVETGYRGSTVGAIVTPCGVICIDTPLLPADARHWRQQIAQVTRLPIAYLIYTDGHRDRVLGHQWLGGQPVAHEATWEKMRSYGDTLRQQVVEFLAHHGAPEAASEIAQYLQLGLPQLTVADHSTLTLHPAQPCVVVRPVGGANPGSVWVELPDQGVMFAGDLLTLNTHPSMSEANTRVWLERLAELRDPNYSATQIVPGRGAICHPGDTQTVTDYLSDMRTQMQAMLTARRGRFDPAELAPHFIDRFAIPPGEHERMQRRVKTGLERVAEELKREKRKHRKAVTR
jgi:glyoxylase-like metal-dependent hydrolase (beta-lactamase superfamily II)